MKSEPEVVESAEDGSTFMSAKDEDGKRGKADGTSTVKGQNGQRLAVVDG